MASSLDIKILEAENFEQKAQSPQRKKKIKNEVFGSKLSLVPRGMSAVRKQ